MEEEVLMATTEQPIQEEPIFDSCINDATSDCAEKYSPETLTCDRCACDQCAYDPWGDFQHWFNVWIWIILLIGLILWPYLICRKHRWEKWLRKKCLLWDLLYFLIVAVIWFIISYIVLRIRLHEFYI